MDILNYIDKNKDISFFKKGVTEVDVLLFSQLSYLVLEGIPFANHEKYRLFEIKQMISRSKNKLYQYAKPSPIDLLDKIATTNRYKDIFLYDYEYEITPESQFGAITLSLPNGDIFISFEGTDLTVSGWYEDAKIAFSYPTVAQKKAGEYLNRAISQSSVYVCGHSKGGNLAVVGSMRLPITKRNKIISIYSFDGPGLKEEEYNSLLYKSIKEKIKNYIPEESIIGVLLKQEKRIVVKSQNIGILQHIASSWLVIGDYLFRGRQSNLSKDLENTIAKWLEKYNFEEREKIVTSLFSIFSKAQITSFYEIEKNKIGTLYRLINATINLDNETKNVLFTCLNSLMGEMSETFLANEKKKIQTFFAKF